MALTKIGTDGVKDDAVTTDKLANAINTERTANTAKDLTALSAANLTSGTIPDARFPATLPAASAANLTAVPAANITGTLPAISGANLTGIVSAGQAHNLVINGAMQVAQRATSSTSESYATVDRFQFVKRATVDNLAFTQSQATDSPDEFSSSYMVDITTAESAVDADEYFQCTQRIEAQDLQSVKTNQVTLSFHVKAYQTGTYTVAIYQQDGNRLVTGTYTINSSATWEKKTITFPANTGTQPDNNNALGWEVAWILAAGSDFTSSNSTSWGSYSDAGYAYGQGVNVASSTDNYWKITGVQLEVGDTATDFAHETYAETLRKCQRYYWKIAQNTFRRVNGYKRSDSNCYWELQCPVPMRTAPSVTLLASGTFTNFQSNFNTTQSNPNVNEWNQDTGWGLLYISSDWSTTHASIPSWEGYSIEFSAEL